MNVLIAAMVLTLILTFWASVYWKKMRARIERIRRVHGVDGPDAKIGYMNMRGKRYTWQITIESVRPRGKDWVVTAWCHEKEEFLIFYASRMYEYLDLKKFKEIKNVPAYYTERYGRKKPRVKGQWKGHPVVPANKQTLGSAKDGKSA